MSIKTTRRVLAAVFAASALLLGACGSGDKGDTKGGAGCLGNNDVLAITGTPADETGTEDLNSAEHR